MIRHLSTEARRALTRGFTLIEVMMAIAIMTVGAVGIMSLQQAATSANIQSHHMMMANEATRVWLERLRRDGLRWGSNPTVAPSVATTEYLVSAQSVVVGDYSAWEALVPSNTAESWAFDYRGFDTRSTADWVYCTNVRFAWTVGQAALRTDVRTWWYRYSLSSRDDYVDMSAADCAGGDQSDVDDMLTGAGPLRAVYATQLIRAIEMPE